MCRHKQGTTNLSLPDQGSEILVALEREAYFDNKFINSNSSIKELIV